MKAHELRLKLHDELVKKLEELKSNPERKEEHANWDLGMTVETVYLGTN